MVNREIPRKCRDFSLVSPINCRNFAASERQNKVKKRNRNDKDNKKGEQDYEDPTHTIRSIGNHDDVDSSKRTTHERLLNAQQRKVPDRPYGPHPPSERSHTRRPLLHQLRLYLRRQRIPRCSGTRLSLRRLYGGGLCSRLRTAPPAHSTPVGAAHDLRLLLSSNLVRRPSLELQHLPARPPHGPLLLSSATPVRRLSRWTFLHRNASHRRPDGRTRHASRRSWNAIRSTWSTRGTSQRTG